MASLLKYLNLFRKGSAEHHGLSDAFRRHGVLFNYASYLWFKAHVQHTISLIQDKIAAAKKTERKRERLIFIKCNYKKKYLIPKDR